MAPPVKFRGSIDAKGVFVSESFSNQQQETIAILGQRILGIDNTLMLFAKQWSEERNELREAIVSVGRDSNRQIEAIREAVTRSRQPNTTAMIAMAGVGISIIVTSASLVWFTLTNTITPIEAQVARSTQQIDQLMKYQANIREDLVEKTTKIETVQQLYLDGRLIVGTIQK